MTVLLAYCALTALLLSGSVIMETKKKILPENTTFMGRRHSEVIKGIAILCVVLSHVGNANGTRLLAPGGYWCSIIPDMFGIRTE